MAEASFVQDSVDRFRDAFGSIEGEFEKVQKDLLARRKKLEKRLTGQRKDLEKRFASQRKDLEKRTKKLRTEIEKNPTVKRIEGMRKDANKQFEQGVSDVLGALQIASKGDVQRIDRKISQLNRKLKEMERAARPNGQANASA